MIENQQKQASEEIDKADGWYHTFANIGNALHTAQDHGSGQKGEDNACQMGRQMERCLCRLGERVSLGGTACAEGGNQGAESVDAA